MNGTVAVCFTCGAVYYAAEGHACTGMTPADRDAILAAASLAGQQPSVTSAISSALRFLSRFPSALKAWDEMVERDPGSRVSLALALLPRCRRPADIARSLLSAAEISAPVGQVAT